MAKVKKAKRKSAGKKVGLGSVLAGAAVAATMGAYYLYGPSGKKHQRQVKGWMLKAKGEVLERVEKLKEVDAKAYHSLVDEVSGKYKKLKHVNREDIARLSQELKAHFADIEKDLERRARSGKRVVKKVARIVKTQIKRKAVSRKKPARKKVAAKRSRSRAGSSVQSRRKRIKKRR